MKSIPYKSNVLTLIHFNIALSGGFPHTEDLCVTAKSWYFSATIVLSLFAFTPNQQDTLKFSCLQALDPIPCILRNIAGTLFCLCKIPINHNAHVSHLVLH